MAKKIFGIYLAKLDAPNSEAHARLELPASLWELHDAMDKVQLQGNEELYLEISVVNVDSHAVVGNTVDWSNQNPSTNMIHFGKVSKLSYNSGRALSPVVGGYVCVRPAQSLPRIISTGDYPASIAAIRSYFTDEQVIRAIAGYVGIDFDTLIAGDYKSLSSLSPTSSTVEPTMP